MGGSALKGTIDICALMPTEICNIMQRVSNHQQLIPYYHVKGKGVQVLNDKTVEELIIQGVTHGSIELYFVWEPIHQVYVSEDFSEEVVVELNSEVPVEIVRYESVTRDLHDELNEDIYWSEP